ncbi:MAG: SpaA isopeptide-forming pilin-related protein, partial [Oscillospiraceae bacterium]|nr:SpaA isopeptide-forming pilin-related protein [Oscillospiraceae bacterium]
MITPIHDLTVDAAVYQYQTGMMIYDKTAWQSYTQTAAFEGNADCKRLQKYCTDAGLTPFASEWWHMNDIDARNALGDRTDILGDWELTTNASILDISRDLTRALTSSNDEILIKSDDYDGSTGVTYYPRVIHLAGGSDRYPGAIVSSDDVVTSNGYYVNDTGEKVFAFCIDPVKPGAAEVDGGQYYVTLSEKLTDNFEIAALRLCERDDVNSILYGNSSFSDIDYWVNYAVKIAVKFYEMTGRNEAKTLEEINNLAPVSPPHGSDFIPAGDDNFGNKVISAIKAVYNWIIANENATPAAGNIQISCVTSNLNELTSDAEYGGPYKGEFEVNIDGTPDAKFKVAFEQGSGSYFSDFELCDESGTPYADGFDHEFTNGDHFWVIGDLPELEPNMKYDEKHFITVTAIGGYGEEYWIGEPADSNNQRYVFISYGNETTSESDFKVYDERPDVPKSGAMKIGKINSATGQPVPGAKFLVEQADGTYSTTVTTGDDGYYTLSDIPKGTYKVTEIYVPLPLLLDPTPKTIYIDPETATEENPIVIEFTNDQMTCVHVYKYDSKTNEPLNGAQFKLSKKDESSAIFTGITGESQCTVCGLCKTPCNADGMICFGPLAPGWYTVSEVNPAPGYILDPVTPSVQTFEVTGKETQEIHLKFDNKRRPELKIIKKDPDGNHLADVEFEIWKSGTQEKFSAKTDSNGEINIAWDNTDYPLDEGSYSIREINVPAGYVLSDEVKEVMLVGNTLSEVVFVNPKRPELEILKVDTAGNPLSDAVFTIKRAGSTTEYELMTDSQGRIYIPYDSPLYPLEPDRYIITEKQAPDHYVLSNPNYQEIVLEANTCKTVIFTNPEKPKLTIEKYDRRGDGSGNLLPVTPVTFRIWKTDGSYDQTLITGADGKIRITDLMPGEFHIQETVTKDGYILNPEVRTIILKGDDDVTATFYNDKRPELLVVKLDSKTNRPLSGAHFQISKDDEVLFQDLVTNDNGEILIPYNDPHRLLEPGTYKVTEIAAPPGYDVVLPCSQNVVLREGERTRVEFTDIRKPTFILTKRNALTLNPIPNTLYNIKWEAPNGGIFNLGNWYTDKNGQIILPFVEAGWYIVTEIRPAPGMTAAKSPTTRIYLAPGANAYSTGELTDSQNNSGENNNSTGPLPDSERDNPYGTGTSNGTGIVAWTPGQTAGTTANTGNGIIVWKPSTGYENAVGAVQDDAIPLIEPIDIPAFEFSPDIEAMSDITVNGIKTEDITETAGEINTVIIDTDSFPEQTFTKDEIEKRTLDGEPETYHNDNYNVQIINVGDIYVDDSGRQWKLEIAGDDVKFVPVSSPNLQVSAKLANMSASLTPLPFVESSDIMMLADNNGEIIDFPLNAVIVKKIDAITGQLLAGATFELYRMSDEISGQNGTLLERFTTDNSGIIAFIGLPAGTYFVKEVKAPQNYTLNIHGMQTALFAPDSTTNIEFTFANYPYGSILVDKIDAVTNEPLSGARFELKDSAGAHVAYGVTDNSGHILFPDVKPGAYIISEVESPSGYQIDTQPQTVYVPADGKTYTVYFKNQPYGSLVIVKKDRETNGPIAGVQFKITDVHGANIGEITPGNGFAADGMYVTDNNGEIRIDHIPEGNYLVTEVYAPAPYLIDDTPKVVYAEWGKIKTMEFWNSKTGALVISKYDAVTKQPLAGATFMVTDSRGAVVGESAGLYTTDETGHVLIYDLEPGAYKVYEQKAPAGYILDNTVQTINILDEKIYYLDFYDQPVNS